MTDNIGLGTLISILGQFLMKEHENTHYLDPNPYLRLFNGYSLGNHITKAHEWNTKVII